MMVLTWIDFYVLYFMNFIYKIITCYLYVYKTTMFMNSAYKYILDILVIYIQNYFGRGGCLKLKKKMVGSNINSSLIF